jgi:arginyl-tRNA--protein-N-Asp/Glu arginylyltransferase
LFCMAELNREEGIYGAVLREKDSRYVDKQEAHLCSLVEEAARKYWLKRNREHLETIHRRMKELRNKPECKDMREEDLWDEVIEALNREVYPIAIEWLKGEFEWIYEDE